MAIRAVPMIDKLAVGVIVGLLILLIAAWLALWPPGGRSPEAPHFSSQTIPSGVFWEEISQRNRHKPLVWLAIPAEFEPVTFSLIGWSDKPVTLPPRRPVAMPQRNARTRLSPGGGGDQIRH